MEQLSGAVVQALATILVALVGLVSAVAVSYLNVLKQKAVESISKMENENARTLLNDAIDKVTTLVSTVVMSIEQEEKQEILRASEDGKVDRDELFKLKDVAVKRVQEQLVPETRNILEDGIGDVSEFIADLVSQQVLLIKNKNK